MKARIAPRASNAPPTIPSNSPMVLRNGSDMESQLSPIEVASPTAPATINAIPKGASTPVKANSAPIASKAPLTIPVRIERAFFKSPFKNFQLIATAVPSATAPATMRPAPRGTLTPENARKAPIASKNPARILVTVVKVFASLSDI